MTDKPKIKYIDVAEFRRLGYLHELNRQFLHPLGLALEVVQEDDGSERFGGVWDYRDDPEGMRFAEVNADHAAHIEDEQAGRRAERELVLGYWIQPAEPEAECTPTDTKTSEKP